MARNGEVGPIEYIIDATIGYPKGEVVGVGEAMLGEWPGNDPNVAIHYRVYPVTPELADEAKLKEWLYKRYAEKDTLLEGFYRTGKFPGAPRPIQFSLARNVMTQLFWLALFYFHFNFWIKPVGIWGWKWLSSLIL